MNERIKAGLRHPGLRAFTKIAGGLILVAVAILSAGPAWTLTARASTFQMFTVASGSMAPAFKQGDRVCAETIVDPWPMRGDIWVFRFPTASGMSSVGIKRVMGLPGDELEIKSGQLWVNGNAISEPYLAAPMTYKLPPITLGPDELFMLGDQRDASNDSHVWGVVPRDHLIGKVRYRVWPIGRFGEIE